MIFSPARQQGFTLVEMIVTILLVSILAVVALPRYFDATSFRSRGFLDEVANAARYGRKLAVASGCDVQLSITDGTGSSGSYALHQRANSCTAGTFSRAILNPGGRGNFAGTPPSGVSLSATSSAIVFDSLGTADPGGVTVSVDDRSFSIVGESGYVDGL